MLDERGVVLFPVVPMRAYSERGATGGITSLARNLHRAFRGRVAVCLVCPPETVSPSQTNGSWASFARQAGAPAHFLGRQKMLENLTRSHVSNLLPVPPSVVFMALASQMDFALAKVVAERGCQLHLVCPAVDEVALFDRIRRANFPAKFGYGRVVEFGCRGHLAGGSVRGGQGVVKT